MLTAERGKEGLVIRVCGRIDSATADDFRRGVVAELGAGDRAVIVDLASVDFVSSAGLRAFLMITRAHNVQVRLCCLRPDVQGVFTMSGFDRILSLFESREEALAG